MTRRVFPIVSIVVLTLVIGAGGDVGPARAGVISYADFSSTAGLTLVGNTAQAGDVLRLTEAAPYHNGAAWHDDKHDVQGGFETTFTFRITAPGQDNVGELGGDGFAFVIQNTSGSALSSVGDAGFYMGYEIANSLAVEFDTFYNSWWPTAPSAEPNGNHVGVQSRGTAENTASYSVDRMDAHLGSQTVAANMSDGAVHTAKVTYGGGTLRVFVDDMVDSVLDVPVDLGTLLDLDGGAAYVGFVAGGDTAYENHDLLSWSFSSTSSVPEPTTLALLGFGLAGLAWTRRRKPA